MDLIYMNRLFQDGGVLVEPEYDLAFGKDENDFSCTIHSSNHCCEPGFFIYAEGTEYGGIVDNIEVDTEADTVTYSGRTWHGLLGSRIVLPLQEGEKASDNGTGKTETGGELPDGYTQLSSITSTGTQYIDTGMIPTNRHRLEASFSVNSDGWDNVSVFGSEWSGNGFLLITAGTNVLTYYVNGISKSVSNVSGSVITVSCSMDTLVVNGTSYPIAGNKVTLSNNMYLFWVGNKVYPDNKGRVQMYSCKIYDGETLVRDFMPCKDASGNVGLYDLAGKQFYGNAGTGSFIAGTAITSKLPDGYTELEYIESSGSQRIDTGFSPNPNTRVVIDAEILPTNTTATDRYLAAVYLGAGYWTMRLNTGLNSYAARYPGASLTTVAHSGEIFARHTFDQNKNVVQIDDAAPVTFAATTWSSARTLPIFCYRGGDTNYSGFIYAKLYSCQIYDNDILVRNYVPCKNASGSIGLYDLVTASFFGNKGTGDFIAGAEIVPKPEEPSISGDVTIKTEDASGTSLVDRHLVISGDANACLAYLLQRVGLPASLFTVPEEAAGVQIEGFQFDRYTDAYTGIRKMLASAGLRLQITHFDGRVVLSAVPQYDFSQDEEFESELVAFRSKTHYSKVNHLICLGAGELENRIIVHLYMDENGNVSQTQTFFGVDEYVTTYDKTGSLKTTADEGVTAEDVAADREEKTTELIEDGTERLKDMQTSDEISIDFDFDSDNYFVGDIVGSYDSNTGISVAAEITKKIVTIEGGQVKISYKVG